MKKYYLRFKRKDINNALTKAVDDCETILQTLGYQEKSLFMFRKNRFFKALLWIKELIQLFLIPKSSIVVIQHPAYIKQDYMKVIKSLKKVKQTVLVFIIHDLESVRHMVLNNGERYTKRDEQMLGLADYLICHNDHMIELLASQGIDRRKMISLDFFDYLSSNGEDSQEGIPKANDEGIIIAGNLDPRWCEYIYTSMDEINVPINLYGVNFNKEIADKRTNYYGEFDPDTLIRVMKGKFGLVWYGNSLDKCGEGNVEHYLYYINPHKVSAYAAAGIPVIVGDNIGSAEFVCKNEIGIAIHSIRDLRKTLESVSEDKYNTYKQNVLNLQQKIVKGHFLRSAINKCEKRIEESDERKY